MNSFSFSSKNDLGKFLNDEKLKKILIICGKNSYKSSGANNLLNNFLINRKKEFFFKKKPYPDLDELKQIIDYIKKSTPDLIIAVGGGSVLDYAKIANVLYDSENLEKEISNSTYKIKKKFTKLVAIPTTAGSGAEVTSNAVIYINKIKYSVEGEELKPDFFFLIPELVIGASNKIKSSSGFDAIAQAMESLISKKSNDKSVKFATKSLEISLKYYLEFINNPNNENTSAMCLAANLAGEAISISKTTAPHAISYPFTAVYNVSHGHAVSLTLNKFLKFNYKNLSLANCNFDLINRYKIIFDITKSNNIESFDQYLENLKNKAKLENNFKNLGINIEKDYSKIISGINMLRLSNNPIELKQIDIKNILLKNN